MSLTISISTKKGYAYEALGLGDDRMVEWFCLVCRL